MSLKSDLEHIVTAYDKKQSTKKNYNIYAIAQYLKRVDEVLMAVKKGKSVKDAVSDGFNDRLRDFILKNLEKRGHIEVSEDVQEFEYTDFDRQTRNKTRPVPARYADNALELDEDDELDEDVQQYDYTDFDRQTRNKTRHVPARYSDNALALDEDYDIVTLDRLQKIMNNAGITDDEISRGIELSHLGYQRLAVQMNVNVSSLREMLNFLITRMREEESSDTIMAEEYEELFDDQRYSYETDALGSVTIRDINSGKEIFLRGHEATIFLNAVKSDSVNDQLLMGTYMPDTLDESYQNLDEDSYANEIASNYGTYNFPWKFHEFSGTGTAEFSDNGISLVSVRDNDGDEMSIDDMERTEITKQAVEFIGSV
jgi:hypothetical protein